MKFRLKKGMFIMYIYISDLLTPYFILITLILIDTISGIAKGKKYHSFSLKRFSNLLIKIVTYTASIFTVRLLEVGIASLYETTLLSQLIIVYLILAEVTSVLENLTLLGVPIPSNFIPKLLSQIKIQGIHNLKNTADEHYKQKSEIKDIIKLQIPEIKDDQMQQSILIYFNFWEKVLTDIDSLFKEDENIDSIYFKLTFLIHISINEINIQWLKEGIPTQYIIKINEKNKRVVADLSKKIEKILYGSHSINSKQEQVKYLILVSIYQIYDIAKKAD